MLIIIIYIIPIHQFAQWFKWLPKGCEGTGSIPRKEKKMKKRDVPGLVQLVRARPGDIYELQRDLKIASPICPMRHGGWTLKDIVLPWQKVGSPLFTLYNM